MHAATQILALAIPSAGHAQTFETLATANRQRNAADVHRPERSHAGSPVLQQPRRQSATSLRSTPCTRRLIGGHVTGPGHKNPVTYCCELFLSIEYSNRVGAGTRATRSADDGCGAVNVTETAARVGIEALRNFLSRAFSENAHGLSFREPR